MLWSLGQTFKDVFHMLQEISTMRYGNLWWNYSEAASKEAGRSYQSPIFINRLKYSSRDYCSLRLVHSDKITNRLMVTVTPNSRRMFGWQRALHAMTSPQNLYKIQLTINANNKLRVKPVSHSCNPLEVIFWVYSQDLGCDLLATILALPYICWSTMC